MNQKFQDLSDYLQTAERGFATMRGQGPGVAKVGYRAGKMFQRARQMLDQAIEELERPIPLEEVMDDWEAKGLVTKETVPPDPPTPKPKNGRRKRI